ncbi:primase alpha helix C-terminal domain-containing protein [Staphylococcus epidermidis]|uniref:primase alpha helix C-terminal domain-containing protein n=1 Tax=Staphylococcus epidermidis TaxID=1282 RepID=UPI0028844138|nr:primase alpha helix C-terminal domain-containing protein [Staphylococcus epidermidis]MDT0742494.1 primase alpha helix C-terminal domain-containing protein [Staphylococcus epidermidis]
MSVIQLKNDTQVSVVWYKNVSSKSFKNFYTPKWSELVNLLSDPVVSSDKYFRGSVVYGDISNGVDDEGIEYEKYRNDNNVIYRDVICLDYDDEDDLNKLHKSIKSELEGFSWFWHTTFRHTNESPRIRLYVPLSERVSANEYRAYVKAIAQKIACKIDKGSYEPSRAMVLPVIKTEKHSFEYKYSDDAILDRSTLKEWAKLFDITIQTTSKPRFEKRDSSHWSGIAYGVEDGGRNTALTSILGHLFYKRVDEHLIYAFALAWNEMCSPPMKRKRVDNTFKSVRKKHYNSKKG